jgi:hypothetical protein
MASQSRKVTLRHQRRNQLHGLANRCGESSSLPANSQRFPVEHQYQEPMCCRLAIGIAFDSNGIVFTLRRVRVVREISVQSLCSCRRQTADPHALASVATTVISRTFLSRSRVDVPAFIVHLVFHSQSRFYSQSKDCPRVAYFL